MSIKEEQHSGVLLDILQFFVTCVQNLWQNLPLTNAVLQDVQCLDATAQTKPESEAMIRRLARKLPQVISDEEISAITDEWKLYSVDDIPTKWFSATANSVDSCEVIVETATANDITSDKNCAAAVCRIYQYWSKVLDMTNALRHLKYAYLGKAVIPCLALSHGNSDVERSFSANKRIVTSDCASL
jgi:hypothetical protein